jgi:hypothetical protein
MMFLARANESHMAHHRRIDRSPPVVDLIRGVGPPWGFPRVLFGSLGRFDASGSWLFLCHGEILKLDVVTWGMSSTAMNNCFSVH